MGKGNGVTRASSAIAPSGMSSHIPRSNAGVEWRGSNGMYSLNTEYGRAGISYFPLDDEYNVIVEGSMYEDYSSKDLDTAKNNAVRLLATEGLVVHMRNMAEFDVSGTYVQMSKSEYGNRAIRVKMASPSTPTYQAQNRELTNISNYLREKFGINTRVFVDNVRGQYIGYLEYPWKD